MLGVKRGTATCAIAKHAASGPTPACHTVGPARARALTERLRAPTLFQHNTCAQRDKSWPPTWRRCYGDVASMHKVYRQYAMILKTPTMFCKCVIQITKKQTNKYPCYIFFYIQSFKVDNAKTCQLFLWCQKPSAEDMEIWSYGDFEPLANEFYYLSDLFTRWTVKNIGQYLTVQQFKCAVILVGFTRGPLTSKLSKLRSYLNNDSPQGNKTGSLCSCRQRRSYQTGR